MPSLLPGTGCPLDFRPVLRVLQFPDDERPPKRPRTSPLTERKRLGLLVRRHEQMGGVGVLTCVLTCSLPPVALAETRVSCVFSACPFAAVLEG